MSFMESIQTVFQKYAVFEGRARRSEYWWFVLGYSIVNGVLSGLTNAFSGSAMGTIMGILSAIVALGVLVPSISVTTRRLHDIGKSGWWQLLALVPCVGAIILIIWTAKDSDPGDNMYGSNPKGM